MPSAGFLEAGRYNAISSLQKWLRENAPGVQAGTPPRRTYTAPAGGLDSPLVYTIQFEAGDLVAMLDLGPSVGIKFVGLPQPEASDIDDLLAAPGGTEATGRESQMLVEFTILGSHELRPDEPARIRRIVDGLYRIMELAGRKDQAGVEIVPPIKVYDFDVAGGMAAPVATNNYLRRDRQAGWLTESEPEDPKNPEIIRWIGLQRFRWWTFHA